MFAVIRTTEPVTVLQTCSTKEFAIVICQLEKDKVPAGERGTIRAVALDDEGYTDILF